MTFKIETGIPVAPRVGGRIPKYPLGDLKKNHSFFVPLSEAPKSGLRVTVANYAERHEGYKFEVRKVKRPSEGFRVWRV